MNNIFDFATSELSQDAMICWMCNNINQTENTALYDLAENLVQLFIGKQEKIERLKVYRQYLKIDVLLMVNDKYAVIIEDKTYTTTHENQDNLYKDALVEKIEKGKITIYGDEYKLKEKNIRAVYYKTGFHYDYDRRIKNENVADLAFDLNQVIDILSKYEGDAESELLDMYLDKLRREQKWYDTIQKKYSKGLFEDVLKYQYGQYLLAKDIFGPEAELTHGSSSGSPWIQVNLIKGIPYYEQNTYQIFARIGCYTDGYRISIRQYDRNLNLEDKNDDARKAKIRVFNELWYIFEEVAKESQLKVVMGGNNGGYFESEIAKMYLTGEKADFMILKNELPKIIKLFLERVGRKR